MRLIAILDVKSVAVLFSFFLQKFSSAHRVYVPWLSSHRV